MQDASFARDTAATRAAALAPSTRLAMVLLGYIPLLHVGSVAAVFLLPASLPLRIVLAIVILYVLPPLLSRSAGVIEGTFAPGDRGFLRWWFTNQLQVIFNRLPLEEVVRLVPGLYSVWL